MISRQAVKAVFLAITLTAPSACAVRPIATLQDFARGGLDNSFEVFNRPIRDPDALVLDVPHDRQDRRVACGAHALASAIRYWKPGNGVSGAEILAARPPVDATSGYSLQEIVELAQAHDLDAFGVMLGEQDVVDELEKGRPVLIPVRVPSVYIQTHTFFDPDPVIVGQVKNIFLGRVAGLSRLTGLEMLSHYVLVVGHGPGRFVLLDPIMGYRTISKSRLTSYRKAFANAAIVFSAPRSTAPAAATFNSR